MERDSAFIKDNLTFCLPNTRTNAVVEGESDGGGGHARVGAEHLAYDVLLDPVRQLRLLAAGRQPKEKNPNQNRGRCGVELHFSRPPQTLY